MYTNSLVILCGVDGQVRRTVGVLVAVAQGRMSLSHIQYMLDEPSHENWVPLAQVAEPEGLYLLEVEYPPHVFIEGEGEEGERRGEKSVEGEEEGVSKEEDKDKRRGTV